MEFVGILLFGVATNLDNLCVGIAHGISGKKITVPNNLLIAFMSGFVTYACCFSSSHLSFLGRWANAIEGILLILVGIFSMQSASPEENCSEGGEEMLGFKRAALLGAALAVNCLAAAIGAGLTGLDPLLTALCVFGMSFLTVGGGYLLGKKTGRVVKGKLLDRAAGAVMILLGVLEFFN